MSKYRLCFYSIIILISIFEVNAYGLNGMGFEAIQLYQEMPYHLRNDISHVCVLNACSHSGLLSQARSIFNQITKKTEKITSIMVCFISFLLLYSKTSL